MLLAAAYGPTGLKSGLIRLGSRASAKTRPSQSAQVTNGSEP
jgi:hypothetical protein